MRGWKNNKPHREQNPLKTLRGFFMPLQATLWLGFQPVIVSAITLVGALLFCSIAFAQEYTDEQIVNAIYKAEGGIKAKKPFGILSVKCESYQECRQICLNTVRNNRKRYSKYGYKKFKTFLEFLASRYCPVEAHHLNRFWLKNVRYFLATH